MKHLLISILFLPVCLPAQTDSIVVALSTDEAAYLFSALGKQPAEQVESLRAYVARTLNAKADSTKTVDLRFDFQTAQYVAAVVADRPWKEVFQLMPKLVAALNRRPKPNAP